jgi:hypothetical protein
MATNQNDQFRGELRNIAAGKFDLAPHAVESFRIRVKKIFPRSKAEAMIKDSLRKAAEEDRLHLYRSFQYDGWNATIKDGEFQFESALRRPVPGFSDKEELNQRISVQDYQKQRDDYERKLLQLEDKLYDFEHDESGPQQQLQARVTGLEEQLNNRMRQIEKMQVTEQEALAEAKKLGRTEIIAELSGFLAVLRSNFETSDSPDDAALVDKLIDVVVQWDQEKTDGLL